jgi:hypothetical protein
MAFRVPKRKIPRHVFAHFRHFSIEKSCSVFRRTISVFFRIRPVFLLLDGGTGTINFNSIGKENNA